MSRPWMPLYVADYLGDTRDLTDAEHGSYILLLMHYWQTGGLPKEDDRLAIIAATTAAKWKKRKQILARFFEISADGIWMHRRVEAELKRSDEISSKRAEAGRRRHANAPANAEHEQTHAGAFPQPQSQSQKKGRVLDTDSSPSPNIEPSRHNSPSGDGALPLPGFDPRPTSNIVQLNPLEAAKKALFDLGIKHLGARHGGGIIKKLLTAKGDSPYRAMAVLEAGIAQTDGDPARLRAYLAGASKPRKEPEYTGYFEDMTEEEQRAYNRSG